MSDTHRRIRLPEWQDPDAPPPTRFARVTRDRARARPTDTCATCTRSARRCDCPDGPDLP